MEVTGAMPAADTLSQLRMIRNTILLSMPPLAEHVSWPTTAYTRSNANQRQDVGTQCGRFRWSVALRALRARLFIRV